MSKEDKILFSIPDFFYLFDLNTMLLQLMKQEPEKFYEDVKIDSIYGSFPGCIWNSGRASCGWASIENIVNLLIPWLPSTRKAFQYGIHLLIRKFVVGI